MKSKKKIVIISSLSVLSAMTLGVIGFAAHNVAGELVADTDPLETTITFSGTNGNATASTLKTSFATAKTGLENDVKVAYKNLTVADGKVGRILAGGYYANQDPINDMQAIRVVSNAAAGEAKLYYGKSSAYMPDYVDLHEAATAFDAHGANFFKIVADSPVTVESIFVNFGCDTKDYGTVAYNADGEALNNAYKFTATEGGYYMSRNSTYSAAKKVIVPDYYSDGENVGPVITLGDGSSIGCFEGSGSINEIYVPETITRTTNYLFYTSNGIKEYTMPYALTAFGSYPIPKKDLEVLNIHSVNTGSYSYSAITSSDTPNLKTINVSYDVEKLPSIVSGWSTVIPTIYYEGTEAEWASLVANSAAAWGQFPGLVICSDTVIGTVTFHFDGATLGDDADTYQYVTAIGQDVANPGTPTKEGKKFMGWYTEEVGGEAVVFPMTLTGDTDVYAHFEDYGAGVSFANPIVVEMGETYNYATDAVQPTAYFSYTATTDEVIVAKVTNAASAFGDYVYFKAYDAEQNPLTVSTGNSVDADVKAYSAASTYGANVPFKARLTAGQQIFITVDGNGSTTRVGDLTVEFHTVTTGEDYTTANTMVADQIYNVSPARYGVTYYAFTPDTTGTYFFSGTATAWCGGTLGTIEGDTFTRITTSASQLNISAGNTVRALFDLTAGVTYYFGWTTNTAGAQVTFSMSTELDPGMAKETAIAMTVDGDPVVVGYDSTFPTTWYKFTAAADGKFRLNITDGKTIYTGSSSSRPLFAVVDADDNPVAISDGRTAHDKVIDVTAGEYFITVTTNNSNKDFNFNIESVGAEATVTIYGNGVGEAATSEETIDAGTAYVLADPTFVAGGYTYYSGFAGWYTDTEFVNEFHSGDVITTNTAIYAKYVGTYKNDLFNEIADADTNGIIENIIQTIGTKAFPFVKNNEGEIISTNAGVGSSTSSMKFVLAKNATISFDWSVSSESGWDKLKVYKYESTTSSSSTLLDKSGVDAGSFNVALEAGNVLEIQYYKDSGGDKNDDIVKITNLAFALAANSVLTYNFNDGTTADQPVEVINGAPITKIADPVYGDHAFKGWYTDPVGGEPFDFTNGITEDTTIYAHWVETFVVTIYSDGPLGTYTYRVEESGTVVTLDNLNSSVYTGFEGWYYDAELTDPVGGYNITVTSNVTVYAKHNGAYRYDPFNALDADFEGVFSNIEGTMTSKGFSYDATTKTLVSGNKSSGSSTCTITLTFTSAKHVSFDWTISSEGGWDKGYIKHNDTYLANGVSGEANGSVDIDVEAGDTITIYYSKDGSGNSGSDTFTISNISISAVAAVI